MTPRQTVAIVLCSVAGAGLLAGVLAVPAGIAVHQFVIPAMVGAAGLGVPARLQNVYGTRELAAFALASRWSSPTTGARPRLVQRDRPPGRPRA